MFDGNYEKEYFYDRLKEDTDFDIATGYIRDLSDENLEYHLNSRMYGSGLSKEDEKEVVLEVLEKLKKERDEREELVYDIVDKIEKECLELDEEIIEEYAYKELSNTDYSENMKYRIIGYIVKELI